MLAPQPLSPQTIHELERLAAAGGPQAAAAREQLERLGEDRELPKELRRLARLALFRLRSRGEGEGQAPALPARPAPGRAGGYRILQGVGGPILGDGRAGVAALLEAPGGGSIYLRAAMDDRRGLVGLEVEELPRRAVREELELAREAAGVDLAAAEVAAMLGGAVATARAAGSGLPVAYFTHREVLEPLLTEAPDGPFGWARGGWPAELEMAGQDEQTLAAWVRGSGSLVEHPELARWALPAEAMRAHVAELKRLSESRVAVLAPTVKSQLEQHVLAAVRELCAPPWATLLAGRFAYVALRLGRLGVLQPARLAAACCLALLEPQRFAPPGALQALVQRTLAPLVADRLARAAGSEPA